RLSRLTGRADGPVAAPLVVGTGLAGNSRARRDGGGAGGDHAAEQARVEGNRLGDSVLFQRDGCLAEGFPAVEADDPDSGVIPPARPFAVDDDAFVLLRIDEVGG